MICNSRTEFMSRLSAELQKHGVLDSEIIEDFEQHFTVGTAEGLTESEVCEKLGEPAEIAAQYADNTDGNKSDAIKQQTERVSAEPKSTDLRALSVTGVIFLDVFILSWALPTLYALAVSYFAVAAAFILSGILGVIAFCAAGALDAFIMQISMFTPAFDMFACVTVMGLGGIMAVFAPNIFKGCAKVTAAVGRLHKRAFTGRKEGAV